MGDEKESGRETRITLSRLPLRSMKIKVKHKKVEKKAEAVYQLCLTVIKDARESELISIEKYIRAKMKWNETKESL